MLKHLKFGDKYGFVGLITDLLSPFLRMYSLFYIEYMLINHRAKQNVIFQ